MHKIGAPPFNSEAIKKHPWFSSMDWKALIEKKVKPPFVPVIKSALDVSNFDSVINN